MKCPHCNKEIPNKAYRCLRGLAKTKAKNKITREAKQVKQGDDYLYKQIEKTINNANGIFNKRYILQKLKLEKETNGDRVNNILALLICIGRIEQVKTDVPLNVESDTDLSNRGHKYKKATQPPCKYLNPDNFKCEYPKEKFKAEKLGESNA